MTEKFEENIAATLARVLPEAKVVYTDADADGAPAIVHIAVPKTFDLREIDAEKLLAHPRRTRAKAVFSDAASFVAYVKTHTQPGTTVWASFDPQTFALSFKGVLDENAPGVAGWRGHTASFEPDMSSEWKAWKAASGKAFGQEAFAEWIVEHSDDITTANGLPTSLQMLQMATEFTANEERALKSTIKLQSGGVRLTYIADPDAGTTESMQMFERFAIGIPVFHGGSAWSLSARLKYRLSGGKVSFFYELVRPDRVHDGAAKELIEQIRSAIGSVPLLMGACN